MRAFSANILLPKSHKAKLWLEKICAKHFRTKNKRIKCWWNWPQEASNFLLRRSTIFRRRNKCFFFNLKICFFFERNKYDADNSSLTRSDCQEILFLNSSWTTKHFWLLVINKQTNAKNDAMQNKCFWHGSHVLKHELQKSNSALRNNFLLKFR